MASQFFYSGQIRRFLVQIDRVFSNLQVEFGKDKNGNVSYRTVPVRYGDASRMVGQIMRENSENKVIPTPMISFYITSLEYDRDRVQEPNFVDKVNVRKRNIDPDTGNQTTAQGNAFTVERLMPVPYKMGINVDFWTSNLDTKCQIQEQLAVAFNPALEIQSTDNFLDWTSLTRMELVSNTWSNRSVPAGLDDSLEIGTMSFNIPIWFTAPAKVKKLGVIKTVVSSVYDETGSLSDGVIDSGIISGNRIRTTWKDYGVLVINGEVQLLKQNETSLPDLNDIDTKVGNNDITWRSFLDGYGDFQNGISELRLTLGDTEIVGTVSNHPGDDYKLLFNVNADTIPTNTLQALTAIIDPLQSGPGAGLIPAVLGQRYIITQDIGDASNIDGADAWGGSADLIASANDIIEYDGSKWTVVFNAGATPTVTYVTNSTTNIQYKWDGSQWVKSWEGVYEEGDWEIVI